MLSPVSSSLSSNDDDDGGGGGSTATRSPSGSSMAIDSNQLLSLCQRIRETTNSLENRIRLTKLRLTSLRYIQGRAIDDPAARCTDDLIELCNLSQKVVQLLDELQTKLNESSRNSIDYQIATQQLIYFTYEWYDRFAPELEDTFVIANELSVYDHRDDTFIKRRNLKAKQQQQQLADSRLTSIKTLIPPSGDPRVRDALLRLRQSMNENERLISTIANNIESTRATIETIFESLQSTKVHLNAGEANANEAIKATKSGKRAKVFCWFLVILLICIILGYLIVWIIGLFR